MRPPGLAFAVGDGVSDDDGVGPGVARRASDGVGGHDLREAHQPATGSQCSAHEQERGSGEEGDATPARQLTQRGRGRDRDLGDALAQVGWHRFDITDLGVVPGAQSVFELAVGHRSVLGVSAGSMASCNRRRA